MIENAGQDLLIDESRGWTGSSLMEKVINVESTFGGYVSLSRGSDDFRREVWSSSRPDKWSSNTLKPPEYFMKIAELIHGLYPRAKKIIEVGVGRSPYTLLRLKSLMMEAEIVATDVDPEAVKELNQMGVRAVLDDLFKPNIKIYEGADLIYSIRPPFELIPKLAELGRKVGADILIIPLSEDAHLSGLSGWQRLSNGTITAYILKREASSQRKNYLGL